MHGCVPLDGIYHTITKIQGSVLYELDNKPIVKIIDELFGSEQWHEEHPVDYLTIGINCGERYEKYNEDNYINRLITGIAPDKQGVVMFEPDLEEGTDIQFMVRDAQRMVESARENSNRLMEILEKDGKRPVLGIYIDCAGRAGEYSNTTVEEAWEVQKALNCRDVPLLGFYSGVEIAPLLGKSRGLDWTGVLIVLAEDL
jgi:small ligand-binding sensory domain FIST